MEQFQKIIDQWNPISRYLSLPKTENDLDRLIGFSDYLMDEINKADDTEKLVSLLGTVGTLIADYERNNIPKPDETYLTQPTD